MFYFSISFCKDFLPKYLVKSEKYPKAIDPGYNLTEITPCIHQKSAGEYLVPDIYQNGSIPLKKEKAFLLSPIVGKILYITLPSFSIYLPQVSLRDFAYPVVLNLQVLAFSCCSQDWIDPLL